MDRNNIKRFFKDEIILIVTYMIIAILISIPFLINNYIFLDYIPGHILEIFYDNIPKGTIVIILFLSGYLTNNLTRNMVSSKTAGLYAGLLYLINPYTYIRLVTGQWIIIFSYAFLPLLIGTFIKLLENKEKSNIIVFIFLLTIIGYNIHILIISLIIMVIIFLFWFNKHRDIRISKILLLSVILFILLNFYWIIPVITAKNTIIDNIGDKDYEVFSPKGELFDIMAMYGFWREGYLYAKDFMPGWQILYLTILSLAIIGFLAYYKDEKIGYLVKSFVVIGIVGFILASGIKGPFGDQIYWLFDNTILKGFRDSQKFVAMIVLAYTILGGLGVNKIKSMYDEKDY